MRIQSRLRRNASSAGSERLDAERTRGRSVTSIISPSPPRSAGRRPRRRRSARTPSAPPARPRPSRARRSRSARRRRASRRRTAPSRTTRTDPRGGRSDSREAGRPSPRCPSCPRSGPGSSAKTPDDVPARRVRRGVEPVAHGRERRRIDARRRGGVGAKRRSTTRGDPLPPGCSTSETRCGVTTLPPFASIA